MFGSRARDAGGRRASISGLAAALAGVALLSGCGGTRQDAHEAKTSYEVQIVRASFPTSQAIARPTTLELAVHNPGAQPVPNLAVTVDSFNYASNYPELAANKRPVWSIERGPGAVAKPPVDTQEVTLPGSGQTAYTNTWALGPLGSGQTRVFSWSVVPVLAGLHTVRYAGAAGLSGKAHAVLSGGGPAQGQFAVNIAAAPPVTYVDPNTGKVRTGTAPKTP